MLYIYKPELVEFCILNDVDEETSAVTELKVVKNIRHYLEDNGFSIIHVSIDDMYGRKDFNESIKGIPAKYIYCDGDYFEMLPGIWRRIPDWDSDIYDNYIHLVDNVPEDVFIRAYDFEAETFKEFIKVYGIELLRIVRYYVMLAYDEVDELLDLSVYLNTLKELLTSGVLKYSSSCSDYYKEGVYVNLTGNYWTYIAEDNDDLIAYIEYLEEHPDKKAPYTTLMETVDIIVDVYGKDILSDIYQVSVKRGITINSPEDIFKLLYDVTLDRIVVEISDYEISAANDEFNDSTDRYVSGLPIEDVFEEGHYFETNPGVWRLITQDYAQLTAYKKYLTR